MTKHVHHDMIIEWAKDTSRVVQYQSAPDRWVTTYRPAWEPLAKYRFKPEPKPDDIAYWKITATSLESGAFPSAANLKLTFDGETDELKSAEVLK